MSAWLLVLSVPVFLLLLVLWALSQDGPIARRRALLYSDRRASLWRSLTTEELLSEGYALGFIDEEQLEQLFDEFWGLAPPGQQSLDQLSLLQEKIDPQPHTMSRLLKEHYGPKV